MKKAASKKSTTKKSTVAKKAPAKKSSTPAKKTSTKRSSPVAPVKQPTGGKTAARAAQPLRFAHPFFTPTPLSQRTVVPGVGTRLLDYTAKNSGAGSRVILMPRLGGLHHRYDLAA
jgi:hypothetical protein